MHVCVQWGHRNKDTSKYLQNMQQGTADVPNTQRGLQINRQRDTPVAGQAERQLSTCGRNTTAGKVLTGSPFLTLSVAPR